MNLVELSGLERSRFAQTLGSLESHMRIDDVGRPSFPDRVCIFPVPNHREFDAKTRNRLGIVVMIRSYEPEIEEIPCIFPAKQGSIPRDQWPSNSPHRHTGTGCRDFPLGSEDGSGKARDSAGCWWSTSFDPEPETARLRAYLN